MFSFSLSKKHIREVILYAAIAVFVILLALLTAQSAVAANPIIGNIGTGTSTPVPPPAADPPGIDDRDERACKPVVIQPQPIIAGAPFEMCWIGNKTPSPDVRFGSLFLNELQTEPFLRVLTDGKTLYCHTYILPINNLPDGRHELRCIGGGGTLGGPLVTVINP